MRNWFSDSIIARVAVVGVLSLTATSALGQAPAYRAPRTADGKPDLNGIWQALNSANWDLQGHAAATGPVPLLGAVLKKERESSQLGEAGPGGQVLSTGC